MIRFLSQSQNHPSVYLTDSLYLTLRVCWSLSKRSWGEGRVTSWTSHQRQTTIHTNTQTYGQFRVSNSPHTHVFGLWDKAREPRKNSCSQRGRACKLHIKSSSHWIKLAIFLLWSHRKPLHQQIPNQNVLEKDKSRAKIRKSLRPCEASKPPSVAINRSTRLNRTVSASNFCFFRD